ncbi:ABC transporter ATP-binding protein [Terrarubrum flagellatum]|uniref:ABC transporter ATP-binding protein n=1 Tax=Terrirubrum flagellatum TaxID=2895980 RepID=UPI0031450DB2
MSAPVLEVSDLATHFFTRAGVAKAVDGVSFELARGETLGLVGESGSGKSVTGFSLLGLIDPPGRVVHGSVRLRGEELVGMPIEALRRLRGKRIAMIFQDPMMTLNPVLSIARQMTLAVNAHDKISHVEARQRAIAALTRVGIPDAARRIDDYPHQFSGGMRQRVAIAIALLHDPDVIVADEPTTALDVSIQAQILAEMRGLVRETGAALIWISHDLATVSSLADRIAVMYAGRLVEEGPTARVLRDPRHPYTRGLIDALPSRTEPGRDLPQIPGSTPSLLRLPQGCPFAPRCSHADDLCKTDPPRMVEDLRAYRCHHPFMERAA